MTIVTVEVNGKLINIDEKELQLNDLVVIQIGDIVPADLKLVEARSLEIDEFDLTGELLPVLKEVNDNPILYNGSRVLSGSGKGEVVAIGDQTEFGKILSQHLKIGPRDKVQWIKSKYFWLTIIYIPAFAMLLLHSERPGLLVSLLLAFVFWLTIVQNDDPFNSLLTSIGIKNLNRSNIQVRDSKALERTQAINIVCFDKTGVLTTRKMEVKNIYFADRILDAADSITALEKGTSHLVNLGCALCNDVQFFEKIYSANPIDRALISFAQEKGVNLQEIAHIYKRIYDKPYESENRYMACGFSFNTDQSLYYAKGDPDVIFTMCDHYMTSTGVINKVDSKFWLAIRSGVNAINHNGSSALALAYSNPSNHDQPPEAFTFLCLLQLENFLQPEAAKTIQAISQKGIRSLMLTGDKARTAIRIAAECGIISGLEPALTGKEIERMSWAEVGRQAAYCSVFARLTPSQKGMLVNQLNSSGNHVVMVGDGPNDGIALKLADVGISLVTNSSSIARDLAKILINDLSDLIKLFDEAFTLKKRIKAVKLLRIILVILSLFGIYLWAFLY